VRKARTRGLLTKTKPITIISPIDPEVVKASYVTLKYAAELTGIPLRILRRSVKNRRKIGNFYFARVADINQFINGPAAAEQS
jgi:hypothetical protein